MVAIMIVGKRVPFARLFVVYAYAAGVTMLASWIPLFVWITEPWKWVLIAKGMVGGCGLQRVHAVAIIGCSMLMMCLFFWSLMPMIRHLRGFMG